MKTIFTLLLLQMSLLVSARQFPYRAMLPIDIPPSEEINCVYIDHYGLLWIGSTGGLRTYNGYSFSLFKSDAYTPWRLPNNNVLSIIEGRNGILWVGTSNGLVRINRRTNEFKTYLFPQQTQHIIYNMYITRDSTLWVCGDPGLYHFDEKQNQLVVNNEKNSIILTPDGKRTKDVVLNGVKSIAEDADGTLYVGTWKKGLFQFNRHTNTFRQYKPFNPSNEAFSLLLDSKKRLWVGTWDDGFYCITNVRNVNQAKARTVLQKGDNFSRHYKIVEDPTTHNILACSHSGITMISTRDGKEQVENFAATDDGKLRFNHCYDICCDMLGNVWVAQRRKQLLHLNAHRSPFNEWSIVDSQRQFPFNSIVSMLTTDGNRFWIGVNPHGLAYFDKTQCKVYYGHDIPGMSSVNTTLNATYSAFLRRRNGELWIGSRGEGVLVIDKNGQYTRSIMKENTTFIGENMVNALMESRDGSVWIGQRSRLSVVAPNGKGKRLTIIADGNDLSSCNVKGLLEDSKGNVWIATDNLGVIRASHGKYKQYTLQKGNFPVNNAINCFEDSKHQLWAISNSGGLSRYSEKDDRFVSMNREYGIRNTSILTINETSDGALWLASNDALIRLTFNNDGQPQKAYFSKSDGLTSLSFEPNAVAQYGDQLSYGLDDGFFTFDAQTLARSHANIKPQLIVSNILINDTPLLLLEDSALRQRITTAMPEYVQQLCIPVSVEKFAVEFKLLNYESLAQNTYAYRLEGYNDEWKELVGNYGRASFENIPAGIYLLHLRAANNDGQWIELPYTVRIEVLPHWYHTWWAHLLLGWLIIIAIFLTIKWYKNHLKTKSRLRMTEILTNITHELLTPLAVISASVDELRDKAPLLESNYSVIQNNIARLTRLLRQILETRKSQEGKLKLKVRKDNLAEFVRYECENIRPIMQDKKLQLQVDTPDTLNAWFDSDKVDKMLYNLLSNAVKYSHNGGCIRVKLCQKDDNAVVEIADEGIGISRDKQKNLYHSFTDGDYRQMGTLGTGLGLSLTYDLVTLHHGTIRCQSEEGKGTTFTILLPTNDSAYAANERETESTQRWKQKEKTTFQQVVMDAEQSLANAEETPTEKEYNILLVEDNAELLNLMRNLLSNYYNVFTAKNGEQALKLIERQGLDVVVSDVMMPVMDGFELTKRIKENDDFAALPVILLTAKTQEEDLHEGYSMGADVYITKPFKMQYLLLRINNLISNRQRIRRRFENMRDFVVEEQHYSSPDEIFVKKALTCVMNHLDDYDYNREAFASDMCVSSSTLYNKLRALTGQNITGFVTAIRLKEAIKIVRRNPSIQISDLSLRVGFNTPKYFSKCFKKEYGMAIKEYVAKNEAAN